MAERRMFAKTIVLSDSFLDMPLGARCLYMTMGMLADDDGFVNAPKSIMRQTGATDDDLKVLIAKKFVIPFESGVIVIKHWRINNYLQRDRLQPTKYQDEFSELTIEENGAYSRDSCIHDTVYIDKNSIGKDRVEENNNESFTNVNDLSDSNRVRQDIQTAVDAWNSLTGYDRISRMSSTSTRYKMLKARISEYGIEDVLKAIDNVEKSIYLRTVTWFAFDWFVRPNNFPKVLEGKYTKESKNDNTSSSDDAPAIFGDFSRRQ